MFVSSQTANCWCFDCWFSGELPRFFHILYLPDSQNTIYGITAGASWLTTREPMSKFPAYRQRLAVCAHTFWEPQETLHIILLLFGWHAATTFFVSNSSNQGCVRQLKYTQGMESRRIKRCYLQNVKESVTQYKSLSHHVQPTFKLTKPRKTIQQQSMPLDRLHTQQLKSGQWWQSTRQLSTQHLTQ